MPEPKNLTMEKSIEWLYNRGMVQDIKNIYV